MLHEITGKIIRILETKSGVAKASGNSWTVQSYVLETIEQYPKRICFEVFGEDKIKEFNLNINEIVNITFDIDAREYNGKWYNSIRARAIKREPAKSNEENPQDLPADIFGQEDNVYPI